VSLGLRPDTPATVVSLGSRFQLNATARDVHGIEIVGHPVTWGSSDPSVVAVSATGLVTALAVGGATIAATVDGQSGQAPFAVATTAVGTVTVTPESVRVAMGGAVQLRAEARDSSGQVLDQRLVTWSSSDPTVATVAPSPSSAPVMVTGVAAGIARVSATVDGKSDTAIVTVQSVGAIAFTSYRDGCPNIYAMNPDGSNVAVLTNCLNAFDGGGESPAWSPDGQKIVFESRGDLYIINAGGSQRRKVSPSDPTVFGLGQPAWSPDGTKLAAHADFASCGACYNNGIVVMNVDGTVLFRIGEGARSSGALDPAWSPDGRIAYVKFTPSAPAFERDIYVTNDDGSVTNLTKTLGENRGPAWSPDGTKIAFLSNRTGVFDLYVMNADGSGVTALTADSASEGRPAWSPDGTKIAFASTRDGNWEIYVMNADGSGVVRLTNHPAFDGMPAWTR
jgi:Tol biopolymer transport system component